MKKGRNSFLKLLATLLICLTFFSLNTAKVNASYSKTAPKFNYSYTVVNGNTVKMTIKNKSAYAINIKSCNLFSQISSYYNMRLKRTSASSVIKPGQSKTIVYKKIAGQYSYNLPTYEYKMIFKWHGKTLYVDEVAYSDCTGHAFCYISGKWVCVS